MYLKMPFSGGSIKFNPATGSFTSAEIPAGVKSSGNAGVVSGHLIAVYVQENVLYVQVDRQHWKITDLNISYVHDVENKQTIFSLNNGEAKVDLVYRAWWSEIPDFRPIEPEMDADEDFLGYVYSIFSDKDLQNHLIAAWSRY